MTIDNEAFENGSFDQRRTNADRVLDVLLANDDVALRARELAVRADVDPNSVGAVLARLRDRGLVRHRRPYWAVEDPETIRGELAGYDLTVPVPDEGDCPPTDGNPGRPGEPEDAADLDLADLVDVDEFLAIADSLWDRAHGG